MVDLCRLKGGALRYLQVPVNRDYLPAAKITEYTVDIPEGQQLKNMVPQGKTTSQFIKSLAVKFRNVSLLSPYVS